MRHVTAFICLFLMLWTMPASAQEIEFELAFPLSTSFDAPYTQAIHSGVRTAAGPYDLDGDGNVEVLVSDYTQGGRVHVIENKGVDTWELVYSTPFLDSTATTNNIRVITGGDLDADGNGEIIFLSGRSFSDTNPNIDDLPVGLYVFESVGDDDYGTAPASIYDFAVDVPDRWRAEQMNAIDLDGDGFQEVIFGNNGADGRYDNWYVLSVSGDIGSGFETWVEELRLSSRAGEEFDPVNRGGGSPYGMTAADLDGDGTLELALQSWNSFNFTNVDITGADTYVAPGENDPNVFLQASAPDDHVAFFGCAAFDINSDGDDEVFCPRLQTGSVAVLNYEAGEDPLQVTADNVVIDLLPGVSSLGITIGDLDQNGKPEIIGSGASYSAAARTNGATPAFLNYAEFIGGVGGDPEDPNNYVIGSSDFFQTFDTLATNFDYVIVDSAGTILSESLEDTGFSGKDRSSGIGGQGAMFVSKPVFLGDADGDGFAELAVPYQGVDDSTYVLRAVFNPADSTYSRQIEARRPVENRIFLRILEGGADFRVEVEDRDIILPTDYKLSANYPNPFNPSTSFTFTLPLDKRVSVHIYDILGRRIRTLVADEFFTAGTHQVTWDGLSGTGTSVASGTYLYTLEYGNFRLSRTMLLVK